MIEMNKEENTKGILNKKERKNRVKKKEKC